MVMKDDLMSKNIDRKSSHYTTFSVKIFKEEKHGILRFNFLQALKKTGVVVNQSWVTRGCIVFRRKN